jgi:hypothetical protein
MCKCCRSQWPRGLRRRSAAAHLLRSWVRIPPGAWLFVCCECCVFSGIGLCDELITRPEESYPTVVRRCVWSRSLVNEEAMTHVGSQRHKKKCKCYGHCHGGRCLPYDGNAMTIWLTWYVRLTPKAIPSDDLHCFSMNMESVGEGMFIIWCISRRLKKKATRKKYSIHPWSKRSGGQFCCSQGIKWG